MYGYELIQINPEDTSKVSIVDNKSAINQDLCVLCGACKKVCPQKCIVIKHHRMNLNNIRSNSWENRFSILIDENA